MKPITLAIAGCGSRGMEAYAPCTEKLEGRARIVAAADINPAKLNAMRERYHLAPDMCFSSAEEMLKKGRLADAMLVCTPDRLHYAHALGALENDYHLLLEKPISPVMEEVETLASAASERKRLVVVCHVLRYTPLYQRVKKIMDSGALGRIISVDAQEMIGHWHFAHSYVRGNWRREDESSPMLLAKCSHDMDILLWLTGKHCLKVSSYGGLTWFKPENAPEGAPARCLDGCPHEPMCPYSARRIYLDAFDKGRRGWPVSIITPDLTTEGVTRALREGPYGRCVYRCDNDVFDHQVVNLQLEDGVTASFSVSAFSDKIDRRLHVQGAMGELTAHLEQNRISVKPFLGEAEEIDVTLGETDLLGHGGGDIRLLDAFLSALEGKEPDGTLSTIDRSVESHRVALSARP